MAPNSHHSGLRLNKYLYLGTPYAVALRVFGLLRTFEFLLLFVHALRGAGHAAVGVNYLSLTSCPPFTLGALCASKHMAGFWWAFAQ